MGESAMNFKMKRASWERRNLWESNAFGYFDYLRGDRPVRAHDRPQCVPAA